MDPISSLSSFIAQNRSAWFLHLSAVLFMTGLIWLIQGVQYPLMASVGSAAFPQYHALHSQRITWIVLPVMMAELMTAGWLTAAVLGTPTDSLTRASVLIGAGLTGAVFAATAFLSVPMHAVLSQGFDQTAHQRLVSTNWVRTIAWSLHAVLLIAITALSFGRTEPSP
jgi:hypothetical protein